MRSATLAVLLAGIALTGCTDDGRSLVTRYCEYGSVSDAQYEGCVDHVTADEVMARDTPAARYARGE